MGLDSFAITALVDELNTVLSAGRIQDTVEIDTETFGFEVYANQKRHYLLLSADNENPRAFIAPEKLRRGVQKPSTLGLLFRTRVEGMRITAIEQPPWERLIIFHLLGPENEMQLVVELIERRANIILVEDGMIIECARRVSGKDNRYRIILPKHEYIPPPPMKGKTNPAELNATVLDTILRRYSDQKAWQALVKGIFGFSPTLAKEIVFRAEKNINIGALDINPYQLNAALAAILPPLLRHQWQPGIGFDEKEIPQQLTVYPLTHLADWQPQTTVSSALNKYHGELAGAAVYEAAKVAVREQLDNAQNRLARKIGSLERQMVDDSKVEHLKQSGELLLAYQYTVAKGQTLLEAQYDPEGEPLKIKLDPELSPLENAQNYFAKYDKAKKARAQVPKEIKRTQVDADFLDQLDADLELAENWQDIAEVQETLQKMGYWQGKKTSTPKTGRAAPLKFTTPEGFLIWVGRNARQNEDVTFGKGSNEDLWLHARGVGGSHVVIKTNGRNVPPHVIEQAASLAAYYSKNRREAKVEVMVAERRYVMKPKRGNPGQVLVRQEMSSVLVKPAAEI